MPLAELIRTREPVQLAIFSREGESRIETNWLRGLPNEVYRCGVKQAMLVAATEGKLREIDTQQVEEYRKTQEEIRTALLRGKVAIHVPPSLRMPKPDPRSTGEMARHLLVKYGARLLGRHIRGCTVEGGQLMEYKSMGDRAAACHAYRLHDARYQVEERTAAGSKRVLQSSSLVTPGASASQLPSATRLFTSTARTRKTPSRLSAASAWPSTQTTAH